MTIQHIIFDLDGTLIDSSPSILQSFVAAFEQCGVMPVRPLTSDIIGPPLMPTLRLLTASHDEALIARLADAFKAEYDNHAYQAVAVFSGVETMLDNLKAQGKQLYIATNKRILPTRKIMQHLAWTRYFKEVYALDYFTPALSNKTDMVTQILAREALSPANCFFVGDRVEDGQAATSNHIPFAMVRWGYLDKSMGALPDSWHYCDTPADLLDSIQTEEANSSL